MTEPFAGTTRGADDFHVPIEAENDPAAVAAAAHDHWMDELSSGVGTGRGGELLVAMLQQAKDAPVELTEKDFDRIGPKAAQVLKDAGVTKLILTPGDNGVTNVKAELKKGLEIDQDPAEDGCRKLKIAKDFSCDLQKMPDGKFVLSNIKGLTAESKILGAFRDATVTRIEMSRNAKGEAEVTSTGAWGVFSKDQTRTRPKEIMDKAETLFDRLPKLLEKPKDS